MKKKRYYTFTINESFTIIEDYILNGTGDNEELISNKRIPESSISHYSPFDANNLLNDRAIPDWEF